MTGALNKVVGGAVRLTGRSEFCLAGRRKGVEVPAGGGFLGLEGCVQVPRAEKAEGREMNLSETA